MAKSSSAARRPVLLIVAGLALALLAGVLTGWLWRGQGERGEIEQIVRNYILEHPEILPQAMENLQKRESASRLAGVRHHVETPFPGAVLGNPQGSVTLVEFTDFGCTYCRQSVAVIDALIAANPDLKVVIRELPILSPGSADAAKMALAAAEQGKYEAFHRAMFAAGQPGPETIAAAAKAAGLDMARAARVLADPRTEAELTRNVEIARQLGFSGTPSWVVGDFVTSGAIGGDRLSEAIAAARKS